MANFCGNNGYSFPAPSVSSPIFSQFNGTNMATTMHQHLVHFTPPSIRDNTALQAGTSDPVCSGAKWQEADPSGGVPWSSASSNSGNVTPTTVWQHTVPSTMPWVTPPSVHNTENMYTFNGLSSPPLSAGSPRKKVSRPPPTCQRRCKRKCETSMEFGQEQPKEKIFVNEERMAARLEQLQIDNNNLDWHPNLEQETWYSQQRARPKSLQDLDDRLSAVVEEDEGESSSSCESDSDNLPRLEMSELLKVGMKTKEILPKLIIDEMNKSAMQVVLWKPPERFISDVVKDITSDHLDKMDMVDIEVTNPSGQPKVAEPVKPPRTTRSGGSTPIPDLLIEAAQMVNNNNTASSSSSQDPDVWHLMTSTPLPDTDLDFTFDDDDMDL